MDGDIVRPGDLHGRVLPAEEIDLSWDGNQISAVIGPDLVQGVSGFGDAVGRVAGASRLPVGVSLLLTEGIRVARTAPLNSGR
jgi:hypothetical protein